MANFGLYTLLTHTGKLDNILLAKKKIDDRLEELNKSKSKNDINLLNEIKKNHNFFLTTSYKPFIASGSQYIKTLPNNSQTKLISNKEQNKITFEVQNNGNFIGDMVVHIKFNPIGIQGGNPLVNNRYRYCAYPGIRLFRKFEFFINEFPTDEYNQNDFLMYGLNETKEKGKWNGCVGQSEPIEASFYHISSEAEEVRFVKCGFQTLKTYQGELDLWIPLIFWFNKRIEDSLMMTSIYKVKKKIEITMSKLEHIIEAYDNTNNKITLPFSEVEIPVCELYVNNIYVNENIGNICNNYISYNIIHQYRNLSKIINLPNDFIDIKEKIKLPIEYFYVGFRPTENLENFDDWYKFTKITTNNILVPTLIPNPNPALPPLLVGVNLQYKTENNLVESITILVDNVNCYKEISYNFLAKYIPSMLSTNGRFDTLKTSGNNVAFINFSNVRTDGSIDGYINPSQLNSFVLEWVNAQIDVLNPCEIILSGTGINILLFKKDSANIIFM